MKCTVAMLWGQAGCCVHPDGSCLLPVLLSQFCHQWHAGIAVLHIVEGHEVAKLVIAFRAD